MKRERKPVKERVGAVLDKHPVVRHMIDDREFRSMRMALMGFLMNVIFAVFNGIIGIYARSAWNGSMAFYYILLSIMRFSVIRYNHTVAGRRKTMSMHRKEINIYKNTSILISIMSIGLGGAVILLVNVEGGKQYPGFTIYAFALYAFIKSGMAIKNRIQASLKHKPILIAGRTISYIDGWVAILMLQTALLAAFDDMSSNWCRMMNGITGIAVCLITLITGIFGVISSKKMKMEMELRKERRIQQAEETLKQME